MGRILKSSAVAPRLWISLTLVLTAVGTVSAAGAATDATPASAPPADAALAHPQPATSVTHHALELGGQTLRYTATAGTLPLHSASGKILANLFFVAYTKEPAESAASRPIAFAFNGGPGASSIWLHLGGLGPKRVPLAADGTALPDTARLVDNAWSWLDVTDLVFVDPIGTGYSRAAEGVDAKQFFDVAKDVEVAGAFIRRYLATYDRWLSPKFVIGESYGTTRAAALAAYLQNTAGIDLDGLLLLSSALNFAAITFAPGNDLPYALALPSYAAVAWYHRRLAPDLQSSLERTVEEAQAWAMNQYLIALAKGSALTDVARTDVVAQLARYTGLDKPFVARSRLRVDVAAFGRQLLQDQGRIVGRLDGRVTAFATPAAGESGALDPALFVATGPLVAALNDYLETELNYRSPLRYEYLSEEVNQTWKWSPGGPGCLYVGDDLAEAMSRDTRLRVFVGAGYFDLATPYLAQRYVLDHLEIDLQLQRNITFERYPAGHQIYTDLASLQKLKADAAAFIRGRRVGSSAEPDSAAVR